MSNRICIITHCDDCPHFDNEYYGYHHTCMKLNRVIGEGYKDVYDIPSDCPLEESMGSCPLCGRISCKGGCFK
jgi:hypothetical protein